jgi:hypothetical protein
MESKISFPYLHLTSIRTHAEPVEFQSTRSRPKGKGKVVPILN